ncbi:MAG: YicC family protein, partial [Spirochaetaceae bacterium]|nr:YicC family protein [Spirochaetaceae bacterium]
MKSMTGYGYGNFQNDQVSLSVEIKSYNNRYMDISVNLPSFMSIMENRIREYLAGRFSRGKIEVSLRFREQNAAFTVRVNREAVRAYGEAFAALAGELGLDEKPSLSLLLALDGVLDTEKTRDDGRYWPLVERALAEASDQVEIERIRE